MSEQKWDPAMRPLLPTRQLNRRGVLAVTVAAALLGAMQAGEARGQQVPCANPKTYTWTLVESPSVALRWPNQGHDYNVSEADEGLLGRIITETSAAVANACALAPSFPCASGSPPIFLLPAGSAEGPVNAGGGDECNRKTIACNASSIPGAGHGGHPAGNQDGMGEYSYLVIHTPAIGTSVAQKGIAFLSGSFVLSECPYTCNDCPPTGRGRDENVAAALINTNAATVVQPLSVSLWLTQSIAPYGHWQVSLASGGAGAGSTCGNGVLYESLTVDYCSDGLAPGTGNFTIPNQKTGFRTYSVDMSQMASTANPGRCNPPGCYIQNVIVPAALGQDLNTWNLRMMTAISKLPSNLMWPFADATLATVIFAYTTQQLDFDGDGVEDRLDPCPNDPADICKADFVGGGSCPAGQVYCPDGFGDLACLDAYLCNVRVDANQDCLVDANDFNRIGGVDNGTDGSEAFGFGLSIGPFNP